MICCYMISYGMLPSISLIIHRPFLYFLFSYPHPSPPFFHLFSCLISIHILSSSRLFISPVFSSLSCVLISHIYSHLILVTSLHLSCLFISYICSHITYHSFHVSILLLCMLDAMRLLMKAMSFIL